SFKRRTVSRLFYKQKPPGCKPHAEKAPLLWTDQICYTDSAVGKLPWVLAHLMQGAVSCRSQFRAGGMKLLLSLYQRRKSCQTKSPSSGGALRMLSGISGAGGAADFCDKKSKNPGKSSNLRLFPGHFSCEWFTFRQLFPGKKGIQGFFT
ncbi:MAG: hypothetical protein IJP07_05765, partial [Firmicutes bacterium]|nr:hypothetical protein [Bacillota bacterium]